MISNEPIAKCRACKGEGIKPGPLFCADCHGEGIVVVAPREDAIPRATAFVDEVDAFGLVLPPREAT